MSGTLKRIESVGSKSKVCPSYLEHNGMANGRYGEVTQMALHWKGGKCWKWTLSR
jgi:hypothetical protein